MVGHGRAAPLHLAETTGFTVAVAVANDAVKAIATRCAYRDSTPQAATTKRFAGKWTGCSRGRGSDSGGQASTSGNIIREAPRMPTIRRGEPRAAA